MLSRCLLAKNSASELSRKFNIKSALSVGEVGYLRSIGLTVCVMHYRESAPLPPPLCHLLSSICGLKGNRGKRGRRGSSPSLLCPCVFGLVSALWRPDITKAGRGWEKRDGTGRKRGERKEALRSYICLPQRKKNRTSGDYGRKKIVIITIPVKTMRISRTGVFFLPFSRL